MFRIRSYIRIFEIILQNRYGLLRLTVKIGSEDEILTLAPFHGDTVKIYKKVDGVYQTIYTYPYPMPFLHAIWKGEVGC